MFKFIDIFAGIGGFRMAFERAGGECVFTCEIDKYARQTYEANFSIEHPFIEDIRTLEPSEVPDHDILLAGFPCQPFSKAGKFEGFKHKTSGTLFFELVKIIKEKQPKAFLLENVRGLTFHNKGETFRIILETLQEELGYLVYWRVFEAWNFVPQSRKRVYIVGFRDPIAFQWSDVKIPNTRPKLGSIMHKEAKARPDASLPERAWTGLKNFTKRHLEFIVENEDREPYIEHDGDRFYDHVNRRVQSEFIWNYSTWIYFRDRNNGFYHTLVTPESSHSRTLTASYPECSIMVYRGEGKVPRKLTPRECVRLMGFPDSFVLPCSKAQSYKQAGNSVVVPMIESIARAIAPHIS